MSLNVSKVMLKARSCMKRGEIEVAMRLYKSILEQFPQNREAIKALASLSPTSSNGRNTEPQPSKEQLTNITSLLSRGEFHLGLEHGLALASKFPDSPILYNLIGAGYGGLGLNDEAINSYSRALKLQPDNAVAHNNLGNTYNVLANYDEALIHFNKAVEIQPNAAEIRNNLGNCLKGLERYEEAKVNFKEAIILNPNYAEPHKNLGDVQVILGKSEQALVSFEKAIQIKADFAAAYVSLGLAYDSLGEYEEALNHCTKAIEINPGSPESYYNLGNLLRDHGKYDEAIISYARAIKLKPSYYEAHNNLGISLHKLKKHKDAILHYSTAIQLNPEYPNALLNRGDVLVEIGKHEDAIQDFDKSNTPMGRARALECLYRVGQKEDFYERLCTLPEADQTSRRVAAISAFATNQLNCENPHLFCKNPLSFLHISHIEDFTNKFIDELIKELRLRPSVWEPAGITTKFGYQTASDLFVNPIGNVAKLQQIIVESICSYYSKFKSQNCLFIDLWPEQINLQGWFVRLIRQGHQEPHIHQDGWLSGVVYLKLTESENLNEGAIKFGLRGFDYPLLGEQSPEVIHRPKKGDIVLFPSSLFHETIPINTDSERMVVAFDLFPKASV